MLKRRISPIIVTLPTLVFFSFFFLQPNLHSAHAASDGINVHLGVDGCNNNNICEPGTGETLLSCPLDCSAAAPSPSTSHHSGNSKVLQTVPTTDVTPPENPGNVRAIVGPYGISLGWLNPEDIDFSYIRIVRNNDRFHSDPFTGMLMYEGSGQYFFDKKVTPGTEYFYTLFARDTTGNFSSGSAVSAHAFSFIKIAVPLIALPSSPTFPADSGNPISYAVHQYGENVEPLIANMPVTVSGSDAVTIDTEIVAHEDDYIVVTGPRGEVIGQYMFSFNKNSGRYESVIPPLKVKGTYTVTIWRYTDDTPHILRKGFLSVPISATEKIGQQNKDVCDLIDCKSILKYIQIGLIILVSFILLGLKI